MSCTHFSTEAGCFGSVVEGKPRKSFTFEDFARVWGAYKGKAVGVELNQIFGHVCRDPSADPGRDENGLGDPTKRAFDIPGGVEEGRARFSTFLKEVAMLRVY